VDVVVTRRAMSTDSTDQTFQTPTDTDTETNFLLLREPVQSENLAPVLTECSCYVVST